MRTRLHLALIFFGGITFLLRPVSAIAQSNAADSQVSVVAAAVLETRGEILVPDHHPYVTALNPPELTVILQVLGKTLKNPHYFCDVQFAAADLDNGVMLRYINPGADALTPVDSPLYRQMIWSGELGFPVPLNFAPTPLSAKAINLLQGSLEVVAGGKTLEIHINQVESLLGQTVVQSDLTQAGITLQIGPAQTPNTLTLKVDAPPGAVESVAVMENGKAINNGYILEKDSDTASQMLIPLSRAPDAQTELVLHVLSGQATYRVPFDIQNIPLPR